MVVVRMGHSSLPGTYAQQDQLWNTFFTWLADALGVTSQAGKAPQRKAEVSIRGEVFYINGRPTYAGRTWQGHKMEGLLLTSRMVQGIFGDLDPDAQEVLQSRPPIPRVLNMAFAGRFTEPGPGQDRRRPRAAVAPGKVPPRKTRREPSRCATWVRPGLGRLG
jgi:hypothetical protein